jgi:hypothetical protein
MRKAAEDAVLQQIAKRSGELGLNSPALSQFNTAAMATNQGDQASTVLNLDRGTFTGINDGDPSSYIVRGNGMYRTQGNPYPFPGSRHGTSLTVPAPNSNMYTGHQLMNELGY